MNFNSFENIMENGAFAPQEQMFHLYNILENLIFQRRHKGLVWSTRLIINFSSCENNMKNGAFAPKEQSKCSILHNILENLTFQRRPKVRVNYEFQ